MRNRPLRWQIGRVSLRGRVRFLTSSVFKSHGLHAVVLEVDVAAWNIQLVEVVVRQNAVGINADLSLIVENEPFLTENTSSQVLFVHSLFLFLTLAVEEVVVLGLHGAFVKLDSAKTGKSALPSLLGTGHWAITGAVE